MRVRVDLTGDENAEALRMARWRRGEAQTGAYQRRVPGTLREDLLGARGELAVAQWLGIRHPGWRGDVSWAADVQRGCDVGGWQVRTVARATDGLALDAPPRQPNRGRLMLVLGHQAPVMWLAGWIDADAGYRVAVLRHDGVGQRDWFRVGQQHLLPVHAMTGEHRAVSLVVSMLGGVVISRACHPLAGGTVGA